MDTNSQKFEGTVDKVSGNVKQFGGKVLNNDHLVAEGKVDALSGEAKIKTANMKEKFKEGTRMAGDAIERVGDKLSEKGFTKIGGAVRKAGDRLEHSQDE